MATPLPMREKRPAPSIRRPCTDPQRFYQPTQPGIYLPVGEVLPGDDSPLEKTIRVEVNQLLYDPRNPTGFYILSESAARLYAFVQCIDRGMELKAHYPARYSCEYAHD